VRGKRIVYLSQHPALALIEALANLNANPNLFPDAYQLIKIHVADGVSTGALTSHNLSRKWRQNRSETQAAGNSCLAGIPQLFVQFSSRRRRRHYSRVV
jgi:hypothetical protein